MYHERIDEDEVCPNCGGELVQESAHNGVAVVYGPPGCFQCGWSEDSRFDSSDESKPGVTPTGMAMSHSERKDHRMLVAVQGDENRVLEFKGAYFEYAVEYVGSIVGRPVENIGLFDYPEPDGDGLWRVSGDIKSCDSGDGESYFLDGEALRLTGPDEVSFYFGGMMTVSGK